MKIDQKIFKAYDIRGLYPQEINPNVAYHLGRAISTYLRLKQVVIGRDMRVSSNAVYADLISGFLESGVDVIDIGLTSTDVFYFACAEFKNAGVMATASHNPPDYGGFKIVKELPYILGKSNGLDVIYELILKEDYLQVSTEGTLTTSDVSGLFINKMFSLVETKSLAPTKVVADSGNGMAGPILQQIYDHLPQIDLIHINEKPDGISPVHGWDPLQPENRRQLQQKVIDEGANLGFAFDGDGDRFFAIDDRGDFFPGDFLTSLFSQHFLRKSPYSKIVYDVRSSWAVPDKVKELKGVPIKEKVGHSFIKMRMAKENAIFGGELTGHYYFKDFYFMDSGILPSLILLEILSFLKLPLSSILDELKEQYFLSGEINIPMEQNSQVNTKFRKLEKNFEKKGKIEKLDGISVIFDDWHFNVRASNTESLIRLNLEAKSSLMLKEKLRCVLDLIAD